jgi:hypothetical protein
MGEKGRKGGIGDKRRDKRKVAREKHEINALRETKSHERVKPNESKEKRNKRK